LPWHHTFHHQYFSDLSFLLASISFGLQRAVQLKFQVVRHVLLTGDRGIVEQLIDKQDHFLENLVT
jgi:hypothetical protein